MQTLQKLPEEYLALYRSMSSLEPVDGELNAVPQTTEPGKRQWETSKGGYSTWAVGQLLESTKADERNWGVTPVAEAAYGVGGARDVKGMLDSEVGPDMDVT
jgi:kinetochore protein Mis12/MTW1